MIVLFIVDTQGMGWDCYAIRLNINMLASPHNSQAIMNEVGETLTSVAPWERLVPCLDELLSSSSLLPHAVMSTPTF